MALTKNAPLMPQGVELAKRLEDLTAAAETPLEREEVLAKAIEELITAEVCMYVCENTAVVAQAAIETYRVLACLLAWRGVSWSYF